VHNQQGLSSLGLGFLTHGHLFPLEKNLNPADPISYKIY
jgi:hypothetical protein